MQVTLFQTCVPPVHCARPRKALIFNVQMMRDAGYTAVEMKKAGTMPSESETRVTMPRKRPKPGTTLLSCLVRITTRQACEKLATPHHQCEKSATI